MAGIVQLKDESGNPVYPVTGANLVDGLADVAKSGDYNDLENKPTIQTINTVNVSVDNNTGTPSATGTVSGTTLSLNFHNLKGQQGIKGQQGNTGSSIDYPYELVNNRITDDATKGLSAAEGNRLGDDLDIERYSTVNPDPTDYPILDFSLNFSTGKWGTSANYKHVEIPAVGLVEVEVTANSTNDARVAWLDSYDSASSGATADITPGSTSQYVTAGTTMRITAPADAKFMYLYLGQLTDGAYPFSPADLKLYYDKTEVASVNGKVVFAYPSNVEEDQIAKVTDGEYADFTTPTRYKGNMGSNGSSTSSTTAYRFYLPVIRGQIFIIRPKFDRYTQVAWVSQARLEDTNNGQTLYMLPGTSLMSTGIGKILVIQAPKGASHLLVNSGVNEYRTPDSIFVYSKEGVTQGDILKLNPDSEWIPKLMSARKRYYTSTTTDKAAPLTLLHLSDIHGNWENVARYLRFADYYSNYFDDLVNTGDTVIDKFSDGLTGYAAIEGAEKILMVSGNHDTATKSGSTYNWQGKVGVDAYNAFIAPFVSNWGVTQPEGAAENGYCYYYKDYTAKGIRLVCVDIMGYDSTEDTWLQGVLADALESGLHVLIATHYAGARPSSEASEAAFSKLACNYTTLYALGSSSTNLTSYNTSAYKMMDSVDAFMQGGGKFAGYIQGHYHADFIAKVGKYPGQLIYSIGSSKASEVRDYSHTEGSRMQDEFQVVAVDTVNTIVKLFKVGANYDRYGRSKGSVCVDYSTGEILGEGYY